jgi:tRNA threonylcarbamoyl adenosine modification protein YeaZ
MKTLALEFSSPQRSVAVVNPATGSIVEAVDTATGHTMKPFAMIESVLRQTGLERDQIECIAVGLGPGSYTGIRAAIALAQGWQMARGVKVCGMSSVECVAAQATAEGLTGKFGVVIDAQRGEFYVAGYEIDERGCRETIPLRLVPTDVLRERANGGDIFIGPEVKQWFPHGRTVFPRATQLARLAPGRTEFVSGELLSPIYLRETTFVKAPPPRPISFHPAP